MKIIIDSITGRCFCGACGGQWAPLAQLGGKMPQGWKTCPHCHQKHK